MAETCDFIYSGEEMPRYCAAPLCNNSSLNGDPSLHLFKFPLKNEELLSKWLINIRRDQFFPNENSYLCSEHFEPSDIIHTFGRTTLNADAVPSIFRFSTMPTCYVPGCRSGYVVNGKVDSERHFFPPPKNHDKLENWNKAIRRTDKQLDNNCRVCDLHFEDYFIEKYYTLLSNGEIKKHEPGKWTLHSEAIPTKLLGRPEKIFPVRSPMQENVGKLSSGEQTIEIPPVEIVKSSECLPIEQLPKEETIIIVSPLNETTTQISLVDKVESPQHVLTELPKEGNVVVSPLEDNATVISLVENPKSPQYFIIEELGKEETVVFSPLEEKTTNTPPVEEIKITSPLEEKTEKLSILSERKTSPVKGKPIEVSSLEEKTTNSFTTERNCHLSNPQSLSYAEEVIMEETVDCSMTTKSVDREASALRELLEDRLAAAKARDVDASLMKLEFGNKRIEWVYRGSKRPFPYPEKLEENEKIQPRKKIRRMPYDRRRDLIAKFARFVDESGISYESDDDFHKILEEYKNKVLKKVTEPAQTVQTVHRPQLAKKHTGAVLLNSEKNKLTVVPKAKKKFQGQKPLPYPLVKADHPLQLAKKQTGGKLDKATTNNVAKFYGTKKAGKDVLKEKTESKPVAKVLHLPQIARKQTGGRVFNKITEAAGLAKKSTTVGLLAQMKKSEDNNKMQLEDERETERILSSLLQNNKPIHKCGRSCSRIKDDDPSKFRGKNPLQIPRLCGWKRHVVKKMVIYSAPCGKIFRAIDEVSRYLWTVKSKLTIDLFCFDSEVYMANEFTPKQVLAYIPDVTFGKENVPVSCVNSVNEEYPPDIGYSSIRYPGKGVTLNLDPEFLCGCDCKDNCQNSKRCHCQQLTVNATEALPSGKIPNAGYKFRRLDEPLLTGIYECNSRCKCGPSCMNRVAQNGLQVRLQLFHTGKKGWGIRCLDDVPQGMFICTYAGELLTEQGASEDGRQLQDDYLAELDHIEVVEKLKDGYESDVVEPEDELKLEKDHDTVKNIIIKDQKPRCDAFSLDVKPDSKTLVTPSIKAENNEIKTDFSPKHVQPLIATKNSFPVFGKSILRSVVNRSKPNQPSQPEVVDSVVQTESTVNDAPSTQDSAALTTVVADSPKSLLDCSNNGHSASFPATAENSACSTTAVPPLTSLEDNLQSNCDSFPNSESLKSVSVPSENVYAKTPEVSCADHLLSSTEDSSLVAESVSFCAQEGSFIAESVDSCENDTQNTKESFLNTTPLDQDPVAPLVNTEADSQDITDSSLNVQLSSQTVTSLDADDIVQETNESGINVVELNQVNLPLLTSVQNSCGSTIQSFDSSQTSAVLVDGCLHPTTTDSSFSIQTLNQEQTLLIHVDDGAQNSIEGPVIIDQSSSSVTALPMLVQNAIDSTAEHAFSIHQLSTTQSSPVIHIENPSGEMEESFSVQTSNQDSAFILANIENNSQCTTVNSLGAEPVTFTIVSLPDTAEGSHSISELSQNQDDSLTSAVTSHYSTTEASSNIQTFTPSVSAASLIENGHNLITDPSFIVKVLSENPTTLAFVECDPQTATTHSLSAQSISPSFIPLSMLVESALQVESEKTDVHPPDLVQIPSTVPIENSFGVTSELASFQVQNEGDHTTASVNLENAPSGETESSSFCVESSKQNSVSVLNSAESTFQVTTDSSLNLENVSVMQTLPVNRISENEDTSLNSQQTALDSVSLPVQVENNAQSAVEEPLLSFVAPIQQISSENDQGSVNGMHHNCCNDTNHTKGRKKPKGHSHFMSVRKFFNEEYCYLMNAEKCGNIGRYLNHSCNPNCFVQNVFVDTHDLRFPWVAFFAIRHVSAGSELTWDYNYSVGSVPGKILYCHCGSSNCRGRLI